MLQLFKRFLLIGGLVFGLESAWGFSLLGPTANGGDFWQVDGIGYALINTEVNTEGGAVVLEDIGGPKNIGEGYRRNAPVLYYASDSIFTTYFESNGLAAVDSAFAIMNSLSNVDSYSSSLSEFPMESQEINYSAQVLGLTDLKSETLHLLVEQLGLDQPERFTWTLRQRNQLANPPLPCPNYMEYLVIQRNFDINLQYSPYVNGTLYSYYIEELCNPPTPPDAITVPFPVDPLANTYTAVAANTADGLVTGGFYTGLTRDDMIGLRYLLTAANLTTEVAATNSTLVGGSGLTYTNFNAEFTLTTSNLTALFLASLTNNPTALQALYPGLVIASVITNFNGTFTYTFANIGTNIFTTNTPVQIQVQTISFAPPGYGSPYGSPSRLTTNTTTTTVLSNIDSGDFFLIPTNTCGLDILQILATNATSITNSSGTVTNIPNPTTTNIVSTNIIITSTNYTVLVAPCEFAAGSGTNGNTTAIYQGIEKVQFVRRDFDSLLGQYWEPITNQYTMEAVVNNQLVTVTFQRVVTQPDILFSAGDLADPVGGNNSGNGFNGTVSRSAMNFVEDPANVGNTLVAGPGVINSPTTLTFNKVGPSYYNTSEVTAIPDQASGFQGLIWASFDGTTNAPVLYPDGSSLQNLENQVLIQIFPTTLPAGANGTPYSVGLSATGGLQPYTWSLASSSAGLPPGLTLSPSGVISGTPTESGTFDDIIIQLTDSASRSVEINYSITINN